MHCTSPTPPTADCDTSSWYSSLIWGATSSARERTRKSGIGETYVQILAPALTSCPGDQTSLGLSRLENYSLFLKELLRGRMLYRFKKPLNQVGPSDSVNLISWMWSSERETASPAWGVVARLISCWGHTIPYWVLAAVSPLPLWKCEQVFCLWSRTLSHLCLPWFEIERESWFPAHLSTLSRGGSRHGSTVPIWDQRLIEYLSRFHCHFFLF